jgi:hypothetical protein
MTDFEFFGLVLKGGETKKHELQPGENLLLSQVTLASGKPKDSNVVYVKVKDQKYVLATLRNGVADQFHLEAEFSGNSESVIEFGLDGQGEVHITGTASAEFDEDELFPGEEGEEGSEEESEEEEVSDEEKNNKKRPAPVQQNQPNKQAKKQEGESPKPQQSQQPQKQQQKSPNQQQKGQNPNQNKNKNPNQQQQKSPNPNQNKNQQQKSPNPNQNKNQSPNQQKKK